MLFSIHTSEQLCLDSALEIQSRLHSLGYACSIEYGDESAKRKMEKEYKRMCEYLPQIVVLRKLEQGYQIKSVI